MRMAAQLYTVRQLLERDFVGTLQRVRGLGYEHVELAGHAGYAAPQLRQVLSDCGLAVCSDHCPVDRLERDLDQAIDDSHSLGAKYLVCPYLPEERRRDEAGWRACAALLNRSGRRCREREIQLCYHNHSFEFVRVGDRSALQLLFDETDPAHVQAELDTYWIRLGGDDPAEWLSRLSGRCPLVHLKDMASDAHQSFAPVGTGILDWSQILPAADRAGAVWGIVEQDTCSGDPLDSLATSFRNLRPLLG